MLRRRIKYLLLFTAMLAMPIFCLRIVNAADDNTDETDTVFSIEPKRCVMKTGQEVCRTKVTLTWQSPEPKNYCIFDDNEELEMACWEAAVRGATKFYFVGDQSITYELQSQSTEIINTVTLTVSRVVKNRRSPKSRKRRFWKFP